ncbi:MAG TPA: hypothetical protein VH796_07090 [Nitrososphaeraceae archaeon]
MLRRRSKRRYIAIRCDKFKSENGHGISNSGFASLITRRVSELFGYIVAQKSSIRDIGNSRNSIFVIRCNLNFLPIVLSAISLMNPPSLVLLISGTIKRLRINLQEPNYLLLVNSNNNQIDNQFREFNFL